MHFDESYLVKHFLEPDERNFSRVVELMALLQSVLAPSEGDSGARWRGGGTINYSDVGTQWVIPKQPSKDDEVATAFREAFVGGLRWHSPLTMFNVTPPPLLHAVAAGAVASLYNQNALWDFTSGAFLQIEQRVVSALWQLMSQKRSNAGGIAVSGGKSAMGYAIKLGINRAEPDAIVQGLRSRHLVFASEMAHYSIEWTLNQLGLGTDACVRIPCDRFGRIEVSTLEQKLDAAVENHATIAAVILCGGDTIDHVIDPIDEVCDAITRVREKHRLPYDPFVYVDLVNGWIWRLFADYDFERNPLEIAIDDLQFIRRKLTELASLSRVDGLAIDLHKTGACPYGTSFFLCRSRKELFSIHGKNSGSIQEFRFGDFHAHHFTVENSRSTSGLAAAWIALNALGVAGLQNYVAQLLRINQLITTALLANPAHFEVVNRPLAWRVPLFVPRFTDAASSIDCERVFEYYGRANQLVLESKDFPQLGFVPQYKWQGSSPRAVLLAYPMSLYTNQETINLAIQSLVSLKLQMCEMGKKFIDVSFRSGIPPR